MVAYATNDTYAASSDLKQMVEEPPLTGRLENVLDTLIRTLHVVDELTNGPRPEKEAPPPIAGVLQLGVECQKAANALENGVRILAKRIGRL